MDRVRIQHQFVSKWGSLQLLLHDQSSEAFPPRLTLGTRGSPWTRPYLYNCLNNRGLVLHVVLSVEAEVDTNNAAPSGVSMVFSTRLTVKFVCWAILKALSSLISLAIDEDKARAG
ncbi:uncharacterized protein PHALS_12017 [Plasmopara halstedii]|uniref:Uncharacterized protein n=1 Tax=Plasmopara halstedii TaxID=4781 RepID=A0A0N7L5J9_PLAHL|nr:uncharacterized protein PHALS_12017 [Plasmopara halstedii]CEG41683.1 hypothetical protein PHALS_12017 [Plasmopara halstedii]|eukprot:XP_024578052.1 hypothetical protein PHALS_12017 [Plasmopara halstedii]